MYAMFHHMFPVPAFLRMSAVGLDIADRRLRFLELDTGDGFCRVRRFAEMDVPPGVIVGGQVRRPQEVASLLKKARRKYDLNFVHVSLPEERAYLVKMEVPDGDMDEERIRTAISAQLPEYVPVPPEEAVFDYELLRLAGKKDTHRVVVSVMTGKEVRQYLDVFKGTGLTPLSFEIEAQAIARAVLPPDAPGTTMIVDFGSVRTGIFIVSGGSVLFTSTVEMGSEAVTEALQKYFSVGKEEVEKMKNTQSTSRGEKDAEFTNAVVSTIAALRDEINKVVIYWQTHRAEAQNKNPEGNTIGSVVLTGGGANLRGLPDYLGASLRLPTAVANPWRNVALFEDYVPPIPHNKALGYSSVIGLALHGGACRLVD